MRNAPTHCSGGPKASDCSTDSLIAPRTPKLRDCSNSVLLCGICQKEAVVLAILRSMRMKTPLFVITIAVLSVFGQYRNEARAD